jgi:4'-phosphopantetheinyl transferase
MATHASAHPEAVSVRLEWVDRALDPEGIAILDADERARAARFRFERDRRRFVARRAFLRRILAEHTGLEPGGVRYRRSAHGKPELLDVDGVAFSTSHADDVAIVAVVARGDVGVDIERVRPMPDALEIARRFFTARESAHLLATPASMRSAAFLRLWTRKEACVKLVGRGLSMPLGDFEVLDRPGGDVVGLRGTTEMVPVRLWPVEVPVGFVATVAATETAAATNPSARPLQLAVAS